MTAAPLFELSEVGFRYGVVPALSRVSLTIERGERVALLGSNGSGKSTLLRILDGLMTPTSGRISFQGQELTDARLSSDEFTIAFRQQVGLLFQDPDVQLFNASVFDEVAFGPLQLRWNRARIAEAVESTLAMLEISHLRDRPPYRLSGGEKKRVALASIRVLEPEVFLFDEPTSALDPRSQSQLLQFIHDLPENRTVVTATHDLHSVPDIANRCCVLFQGEIVATGTPQEILENTGLLESVNLIHNEGRLGRPHYHPHF